MPPPWIINIDGQWKLGWRCAVALFYWKAFPLTAKIAGLIMHNLSSRKQILNIPQAHKGKISGICFSPDGGERLLTCGVDRNVKLWAVGGEDAGPSSTVSDPCI